MHPLAPSVSAWFAAHHGVAARDELLGLGVSVHQLRRLVAIGVLVVEARSIYRLAGAPATELQGAALACAIAPHVMVSHISAGRLWGLRRLGPDRRLHVSIGGRSNRVVPGTVVHRTHRVGEADVVTRADGIRLTSPPRTVFDLAAILGDDSISSIIEQVLHERLCTVPTLFATGRRLREQGRPGSARFARVLQSRPAFAKPVASDLELRLERAIVAAGLPRPVRQAAITLLDGSVVRPDFYWPEHREALEVDHVTWHGGKLDLTYDKQRDRQLRKVGVHVTRVTDSEITSGLDRVIADLGTILMRSRAA